MKVFVEVPAALRQYTRGNSQIEVDAVTVEVTLLRLDQLFPGLKAFLVNESRELRRYVNIAVNDDKKNAEKRHWML